MASDMALPLKGVSMSLGGRGLDTLLTSDNYYDKKTGGYSLLTGLQATGSELTDMELPASLLQGSATAPRGCG